MTESMLDPPLNDAEVAQDAAATTDTAAQADDASVSSAPSMLQQRQAEWGALKAQQHQLIRLAALPADRATGLRPLQFASLARVSRHSKEVSMLRLSLEFAEQATNPQVNTLEVWVDHLNEVIYCLPEHGLQTDPGNRGLGRLLLAQAVRWCQQDWRRYRIHSVDLLVKQAKDDAARLRRDHALQAQGFVVTYQDAVNMSAVCSATSLSQLHSEWNQEKVRIVELIEAAQLLQSADQNLRMQAVQLNKLDERIQLLQRDENTLRFTIFTLVIFTVFQAGLMIWMATR